MKQTHFYGSRTEDTQDNWETPPYLFKLLDKEFDFDVDLAASESNHLCEEYYTKENSGLDANLEGKNVFCNPPYNEIEKWVKKCYEEGQKKGTIIVMLIPARTDTKYFHTYCMNAFEIRLVKGRISFLRNGKKPKSGGNNHPSCIVIFCKHEFHFPSLTSFYHKESDLIKQECDIEKWI